MKRILFALSISALIVGSGCDRTAPTDPGHPGGTPDSGNPGDTGDKGQPFVLRVDLPRGMLYVNDTTRVHAFVIGTSGDSVPLPASGITWSTDNENVLAVSESGLLRGVGYGTATLVAERQSQKASIQIRVAGTLHTGTVRESETWSLEGSPHVVESNLRIAGDEQLATLTVEAGVTVLFRKSASLSVGLGGAGALVADGSDGLVRFEAEDTLAPAGAWRGLEIMGAASSTLRNVLLRQCGAPLPADFPYPGCLRVRNVIGLGAPTITLVDVEIRQGQGYGFVIEDGVRVDSSSMRLSVREVDGYAGWYPASQLKRFPYGGTFDDLTHPAIVLWGGELSEDVEWSDPGVPWLLVSDLVVEGPSEPVLRLSPGLNVQVDADHVIFVGMKQPGRLVAGSLDGAPIDIRDGVWHGGGGWGGLSFGPYAGPSSLINVRLDRCSMNCLLIAGDDAGSEPAVLVEAVRITNAGTTGVRLARGGRFAEGSRDLHVTGSNYFPVGTPVETVHTIPPGEYLGNGTDKVLVYDGTLRQDVVWRDLGLPYEFIGSLGVENSVTLTLEPGVRLEFRPGAMIYVGLLSPGTLRAIGTIERPVVFTSSLPNPEPGRWMGVEIRESSGAETLLEHVVVEWGGIRVSRDLGPIIRNVLVRGSGGCAIRRDGPGIWITDFTAPHLGNRFEGNAGPDQCGP